MPLKATGFPGQDSGLRLGAIDTLNQGCFCVSLDHEHAGAAVRQYRINRNAIFVPANDRRHLSSFGHVANQQRTAVSMKMKFKLIAAFHVRHLRFVAVISADRMS